MTSRSPPRGPLRADRDPPASEPGRDTHRFDHGERTGPAPARRSARSAAHCVSPPSSRAPAPSPRSADRRLHGRGRPRAGPTDSPWTSRRQEFAPRTTRAHCPTMRPALGQTPGHGGVGVRFPARSRRRTPRSSTSQSSSDPISTGRHRDCVLVCAAPTARRCRSGTSEIGRSRRQRESFEVLVILRNREQQIRKRRCHRHLHVAHSLVLLDRQHHDGGLAAPRHPR